MHIDWFTVTAQLVNFLLLVYLLKRFLYARVIAAMDKRQARISEQLGQAEKREQLAERVRQAHQQRLDEFERTRAQALARVEHEAAAERSALLGAIREEATRARSQWQESVAREREQFVDALSAQSIRLTVDLARRTLLDLADVRVEQHIVDRFIADLQNMDAGRHALLRAGAGPVQVFTAFALDEALRVRIRAALATILGAGTGVEFRQRKDLGCGIELVAGHARVGSSVQSHLARFERDAAAVLTQAVDPLAGTTGA